MVSPLSLPLSLFPNGHCMCAGYLTHTISPAGLVALHRCRLSHLYNINSLAFSSHSPLSLFPNGHCMCAGYLTHTILPAGLVALHRCRLSHLYNINCLAFSSHSPLSLFSNGHCMCAGYLTHTISPAGLVALHRCRLSHLYNINCLAFSFRLFSLSSQMAIVCVQAISHIQYCQLGSLHYIGAGYLTYIISTALLLTFSSLSSLVTMGLLHLILLDGMVKRYC